MTRSRSTPCAVAAAFAAALLLGGCGGGAHVAPRATPDAPPDVLVAAADSSMAGGDIEGARRLLTRAQQEAPESAFVFVAWGKFHTAIRRYKDAKEALDRAAALAPRSPDPLYWLGRAFQQSGDNRSAADAYARALVLDPGYRPASEALTPILGVRYEAAGIPADYPTLRDRATISRGELAVMLAVELGADPDRSSWRSDAPAPGHIDEIDRIWGDRWARAAALRGWISPFADGTYRLDDPVTRAALAWTVVGIERRWGSVAIPDSGAPLAFSDLGARHYLALVASAATRAGLPPRGDGTRFEPWAAATGVEALQAVRGVARVVGATPVVSAEPR